MGLDSSGARLIPYDGQRPAVDADAWVAPGATVVGSVTLAALSSVWYSAVVRADTTPIAIGERSNLQDGVVCHADPGFPLVVGDGVTVGHRAVLHGCTIEDDVLVGMGSVVMNGAVIGTGSLVAAGTVVLEGTKIPPRSLVAGVPGKVRREVTEAELEKIRTAARGYVDRAAVHSASHGV